MSDPLEKPQEPARVNYANGVLLDEKDFRAEQTYLRGRLSRALAHLHGEGTIAGLEVSSKPGNDHVITISPGLAIDRIGRIIELRSPYCVRAKSWFDGQEEDTRRASYENSRAEAAVADLFVRFHTCPSGMTPAFGSGNVDATDAFVPSRLVDSVAFEMHLRTEPPDLRPQPDPNHGLDPPNPDSPLDPDEALGRIRTYKLRDSWEESLVWNPVDNSVIRGPEHLPEQDGTELLIARLLLPCGGDPPTYDTNGQIAFDNSIRLFCLSVYELSWLIQAMRGDQS